MTLNPISIATGGYVCGSGPASIPIATDGYVCFAGVTPTPPTEEGGGSGGPAARRSDQPHGAYIPTIRLPRDIDADTVYDDAELALLAVMLIEEFYE